MEAGSLIALVVGVGDLGRRRDPADRGVPEQLGGQRRKILWPIRTAIGLEPETDSTFYRGTGTAWVAGVIGALSTIALLWAFAVLLRSARAGRHLEPDDELALRRLLRDYGEADSLGYFATRRDKMVLFAPDGRAAVTYRVEAGTSLASADPIGDPRSWPAAIDVVDGRGARVRLGAGRDRGQRARGHGVSAGRDAHRQPR